MTPLAVIVELLARLGASRGAPIFVNARELDEWPVAAVMSLRAQQVLTPARPATSVTCRGCERACRMRVHTLPSPSNGHQSFVVCDKRDDINRVHVPDDELRLWRFDAENVCAFISASLGFSRAAGVAKDGLWPIGVAAGAKRRQMLSLRPAPSPELVAGNAAMPLPELFEFRRGVFSLNAAAVSRLVDSSTTGDARYTPNNARREARKLDTQALHRQWQTAYRALKRRHPDKSDSWCASRIAEKDASRRSAGTVRKNMKR